jgi:hypothetical protein
MRLVTIPLVRILVILLTAILSLSSLATVTAHAARACRAPGSVQAATLTEPRAFHSSTLLPDGRVLIAGGGVPYGQSATGVATDTSEIYDPATRTLLSTEPMHQARMAHGATLLDDGTVLVSGGFGGEAHVPGAWWIAGAEIFDPRTGHWTVTADMTVARSSHTQTLLADGRVLVTGNALERDPDATAEIYEPSSRQWRRVEPMMTPRAGHRATLLDEGSVLVTGGFANAYLGSAELFDPDTDTWRHTSDLLERRYSHTATRLLDGRVLVCGGEADLTPLESAELYDPGTGIWSTTGRSQLRHFGSPAALLSDGSVLVSGGVDFNRAEYFAASEIYDPATEAWRLGASMASARRSHSVTLLGDGSVLIAGGYNSLVQPLTTEQYLPAERADVPAVVTGMCSRDAGRGLDLSSRELQVRGSGFEARLRLYAANEPKPWRYLTRRTSRKVVVRRIGRLLRRAQHGPNAVVRIVNGNGCETIVTIVYSDCQARDGVVGRRESGSRAELGCRFALRHFLRTEPAAPVAAPN